MEEMDIQPLKVKQWILASTPKSQLLHTGSILTSGVDSFHILFDRADLGVQIIKDINLIPINSKESLANGD